ncbi:MAG: single-stranded DNA-binding protein [Chloroflexi bacterium]|nr:MAG: single-stranded DNA-binding protein [Chloroflexota bacterium]
MAADPPDGPTAGAGASPLAAEPPRRARRPRPVERPPHCSRRNAATAGRSAGRSRRRTRTVNKVLLTGRLTRDPEMRSLASGKAVTQFSVATNEYIGQGKEKAEYHNIVTWDRLAQTCGEFLGKGQQVAIEGRIQTRSWDDDRGQRHWKTEIVASHVEMLSGRRKKDYAAENAANGLAAQASVYGEAAEEEDADEAAAIAAAAEPIAEGDEAVVAA